VKTPAITPPNSFPHCIVLARGGSGGPGNFDDESVVEVARPFALRVGKRRAVTRGEETVEI